MKRFFSCLVTAVLLISCLCSVTAYAAIDLDKYKVDTYEAPYYFSVDIMESVGTIWQYEYSTDYNLDFKPMEKKLGLYVSSKDGDTSETAALASPWNTDNYLFPGSKGATSINAVQTFVAPSDGYATVRACDVIRHYGYTDSGNEALQDCEIAVYLNDKIIWPTSGKWQKITAAKSAEQPKDNTVTVPELTELKLKAGDKIRFAVGCGSSQYSNWNDYVKWYAKVDFYTLSANNASVAPSSNTSVSSDTSSDTAVSSEDGDISDNSSDVVSSDDIKISDTEKEDGSSDSESVKSNTALIVVIVIMAVVILVLAALVVLLYLMLIKKIATPKFLTK